MKEINNSKEIFKIDKVHKKETGNNLQIKNL